MDAKDREAQLGQAKSAWRHFATTGLVEPAWVEFEDPATRVDLLADVVRWSLSASQDRHARIAAVAHSAYRTLSVAERLFLDVRLRHSSNSHRDADSTWHMLSVDRALRLPRATVDQQFLVACVCAHPSGRVREAIVSIMHEMGENVAVPWLLLRSNDWVHEIRTRAGNALLTSIERARSLPVELLGYAHVAARWSRAPIADLLASVDNAIVARATPEYWLTALRSNDANIRRHGGGLLCSTASPPGECIAEALCSPEPSVQFAALRRVDAIEDDAEAIKWRHFALFEAAPRVRREAFLRLLDRAPDSLPDRTREFLFSKSHIVRKAAQRWMRSYRNIDPAALYRAMASEQKGRSRAVALLGVSECGVADDIELIARHQDDAAPVVRAACIEALAKIDADGIDARCLSALGDASPQVFRAAAHAVRQVGSAIDMVEFWNTASRMGPSAQTRALQLVDRAARWEALIVLLRSQFAADNAVRSIGARQLDSWMQRLSTSVRGPSTAQANELRLLLDTSYGRLEPEVMRTIRFAL